jgi:hypothetical protein
MPTDPAVRIVRLPETLLGVLRFSGGTEPDAVAERARALLAALEGSPWQAAGTPFAQFYDPPFTIPPLRRNEVAVEVSRR